MKAQRNFLSTTLFVLISCFSVSLLANTATANMIVRITKLNDHSINLQVANIQQRTEIKIVDLNGQPWFSTVVKKTNAYAKQLNLSAIPTGNYIVYVKNDDEKHIQAFAKSSEEIAFFESSDKPATNYAYAQLASNRTKTSQRLITRVSTDGDKKVEVQLANLMNKKTSVQVRFLTGVELVRDQVRGEAGYAKSFNCEGMTAGDYYVVVRTGKTTFLQFFMINEAGIFMEESQRLDNNPAKLDWAAK